MFAFRRPKEEHANTSAEAAICVAAGRIHLEEMASSLGRHGTEMRALAALEVRHASAVWYSVWFCGK